MALTKTNGSDRICPKDWEIDELKIMEFFKLIQNPPANLVAGSSFVMFLVPCSRGCLLYTSDAADE